jgi:hypothetical protein
MILNELMNKIREILPSVTVGQDDDGQIIIYTNCNMLKDSQELIPFEDL